MIPIQNGLICWLDATTGKNENTIWKDLSGSYNDFILQGFTFDGTNGWTETSIKKTKTNFIHTKNKIKNFRSIIIKVKITDWTNPSYLIDLRPDASAWIYSTSRDGIGDKINTQKIYKNGVISQLDLTNMLSDDFVYYYLELTSNITCPVFLGSRHTLNEGSGLEIQSVFIYNRTLSEQEINNMCKQINNQYVNENNLPTIVDKLMDASNIKIANNKYGNRVQTVIDKIVEKADNVTKAINQEVINTEYSFKVGAGTNVDVSSDVQDGFSNITIKGNTYQNLINTNSNIFFAGSSRYENRVNINNKKEVKALSDGSMALCKDGMFKDSTTYTVVANVYVNRSIQVGFSFKSGDSFVQGLKELSPIKVGDYVTYIVQITTTTNCTSVVIGNHGDFLTNDIFGVEKLMVFEGDYTNNPNLPAYFEGIAGVGKKSKNLFNGKLEKAIIDVNGFVSQHPNPIASVDFIKVKPNTTYLISMPTQVNKYIHTYDRNFNVLNQINTQAVFTTPNNCEYIKFNTHSNTVIEITEPVQIEEGTVTTPYESYYEGYKIEILSQGKNLFNPKDLVNSLSVGNEANIYTLLPNGFNMTSRGNGRWKADNYIMTVKENTKYRVMFSVKYNSTQNVTSSIKVYQTEPVYTVYKDLWIDSDVKDFIVDFTTIDSKILKFQLNTTREVEGVASLDVYNIMLIEYEQIDSFIPYKEDEKEILLDEPLIRLPNGVCDEITKDGKLIRRVGKYTFTGYEDWQYHTGNTTNRYRITHSSILKQHKAAKINAIGYCDNILLMPNNQWNTDIELIEDDATFISIRKAISTVEEFKTWLLNNPTTIYYELETPIITDIIPPSVRIYKDGHLKFNTLVVPESTHLVQLNKSAQINNTLEQVQFLNKKVDALDIIYNSLISSTSNTLSNLKFK